MRIPFLSFTQSLKPDIPFSREDANRFLPWVVGLMVCLSGLFLAAALSIHDSSLAAGRLNADSFQIYISHEANNRAVADKVRDTLKLFPEIGGVKQLQTQDIEDLIAPWTGRALKLDDLPLPLVLEVTVKAHEDRAALAERVTSRLKQIDSDIEVESYQQWVDQLIQFTGMLRVLAILFALLILIGLSAMIVIAARTSLKLHFRTVQLLHHIGASDEYIIRQFVVNGVWVMLRGALPGAGLAAIVFISLAFASSALSSPLLPRVELLPHHIVLFLLLPVFTGCAAYGSVRATVRYMLESMH